MNKRIVILTKSSKFGQLCVAGIDYENGEGVRLVSTDASTHGAVSYSDLQFENGRSAELLDVIDVEVTGSENNPVQPENYVIDRDYYVGYVKTISIEEAIKLYKGLGEPFILGDSSYYVDEEVVATLGRSLSLEVVDNLRFEQVVNDSGQPKTKLSFEYNRHHYSSMSVTDPRFYNVHDGQEFGQAAIVVSIGTPFRGRCYKFVAAIYPLVPF